MQGKSLRGIPVRRQSRLGQKCASCSWMTETFAACSKPFRTDADPFTAQAAALLPDRKPKPRMMALAVVSLFAPKQHALRDIALDGAVVSGHLRWCV